MSSRPSQNPFSVVSGTTDGVGLTFGFLLEKHQQSNDDYQDCCRSTKPWPLLQNCFPSDRHRDPIYASGAKLVRDILRSGRHVCCPFPAFVSSASLVFVPEELLTAKSPMS
jgi:hypothetical protein